MPLFEYECRSCGHVFEVMVKPEGSGSKPTCPECGNADLERLWSPFSGRSGTERMHPKSRAVSSSPQLAASCLLVPQPPCLPVSRSRPLCPLPHAHCLLPCAFCWLPAALCPLQAAYRLLPAASCPLPFACPAHATSPSCALRSGSRLA